MRKVAVLGGGPAGAFAAEKLANGGLDTILIDEKMAWEKPCGGGLTYKAYSQYPFLIDNDTPKKLVSTTCLSTDKTGAAQLTLDRPLLIYSRFELNQMLLNRAEKAGAALEKTRVLDIERREKGWMLTTRAGKLEADFCVVAMGARNPLREVGTKWAPGDTATALGYFVPTTQPHIDIQFFPQFEGYIWVFPREGHLSVGICGKGEPAQVLRTKLERYMREKGIPIEGSTFYGHVLPSLQKPAWKNNRVAGDGWMAVGDAAGLVDPVTGEGLYYAIRSGDLASKVVLADAHSAAEQPLAYERLLQHEFTEDLEFAARIAKRLFMGQFLYENVPARMIQFIRKSPTFCDLMQDLFAGTQNYMGLKKRLMDNMRGTVQEILMNLFFHRLIPRTNRA
jgi:geranylgeranyl reductase family protein